MIDVLLLIGWLGMFPAGWLWGGFAGRRGWNIWVFLGGEMPIMVIALACQITLFHRMLHP